MTATLAVLGEFGDALDFIFHAREGRRRRAGRRRPATSR